MTKQKNILLITTGGTIAGRASNASDIHNYQAGAMSANELLQALPKISELGNIQQQELFNEDSRNLGPQHWQEIARAIGSASDDKGIDGIVITHGSDTLEETAFFCQLVLDISKPVIFTAAMRPATALSADGPMNLYQAIRLAGMPGVAAYGTLVVAHDEIHLARYFHKKHPGTLRAFSSEPFASIGNAAEAQFYLPPPTDTKKSIASDTLLIKPLPDVEIIYVGAGSDPVALEYYYASDIEGLVLALPGNGSLPQAWQAKLTQLASKKTLPVVRASRCGSGMVTAASGDNELLFASGYLTAAKARVALIVALRQNSGQAPDKYYQTFSH